MKDYSDHVKILKKAKMLLEVGHNKYICYAIDDALSIIKCFAYDTDKEYIAMCEIKKWIMSMLDGASCIETWLHLKGFLPDRRIVLTTEQLEQVKKTRIAWINWMIYELE